MGALRIEVEENGRLLMPAAGMPWFVAVFGRDSIIASCKPWLLVTSLGAAPCYGSVAGN